MMIGAILGDTIGSMYENIPSLKLERTHATPTDDSFLTCACQEWLLRIKAKPLYTLLDNEVLQQELIDEAIIALKRWGRLFPEQGFSRSFMTWVNTEPFMQTHKKTNGCLMRQSPIASFCVQYQYALDVAIKLSELFTRPTHDHETVYPVIKSHITCIYMCLTQTMDTTRLRAWLKSTNMGLLPPSEWAKTGSFIWDAPRSLSIAYSSLYYADSFESTMAQCIACTGDTDTYCAIAGPIAQAVWGIPDSVIALHHDVFKEYPLITQLYPELLG